MANAGDHKPNGFTPVVAAMDLADYVLHITDNANKFPEFSKKEEKNPDSTITAYFVQRQDSLVNRVREQAWQIYILAWTANEINIIKQPWRKDERLQKEKEAIRLCGEHLAAIQLCRRHFHLSYRKVKHWGEMVIKTRAYIEKWHESDKDRYKGI